MKALAVLLALPAMAAGQDDGRWQLSAAAGPSPHAALAGQFNPVSAFGVGVEVALTHDAGRPPRNDGDSRAPGIPASTARWLTACARLNLFPSASVSPFLAFGYGRGAYRREGERLGGAALTLGAGLDIRLGGRASVFVEGRGGIMDVLVGNEDAHMEAVVRAGLRFRP